MAVEKLKYTTNQLFNFSDGSYLERTSRPIYAAAFLLPFIVIYELGTIFINTDLLAQSQVRVVAFVWLRDFLHYLGFGDKMAFLAPPLAVIVLLLSLQVASGKKWRLEMLDLGPMWLESVVLAIPLIVLSIFLNSSAMNRGAEYSGLFDRGAAECSVQAEVIENYQRLPVSNESGLMADIVTGIGAGIYEELIFRLILICLLMIFFQDLLKFGHHHSILFSVVISAVLFSAHHHILFIDGQFGQSLPFNWTEFFFRSVAGVYFAGLFALRGFGIAAGTHAFYDIIAVMLNYSFFNSAG